ncbi:TetR/AcrR family transcriptional regulator [Pseudonocardiaceae bacterium YIM PH 21723]|nr:TetR/AcrR family transcriptional regulator [Pseudonocardiaceae bacterium YIM PH 21723]
MELSTDRRARVSETRSRILAKAGELFAERGYHGTSTRDIAEAVGIRQPSLYNHFATKQHILAAMIDCDLIPSIERLERALALDGPVAPRLHAYIQASVAATLTLPFDAGGLFGDPVVSRLYSAAPLAEPDLSAQAARVGRRYDLESQLISAGITGNELVAALDDIRAATAGLLFSTLRDRALGKRVPEGRGVHIADFVLRAALVDGSRFAEVTAEGTRLLPLIA